MQDLKALVFDFDGTLARLEIDFDLMRREVLRLAGQYGQQALAANSGYVLETIRAVEQALAETDPGAADEFTRQAMATVEGIEIEAAGRGGLLPAARPSLEALKEAGFKLAVITRNFGRAVEIIFPDLKSYCPVFLPREKVTRVKPDPAHLKAALSALKTAPNQAMMVGDHPIDVQTGREAGTLTAGVATGRHSLEELAAVGADLTFPHIGQLADYLLAGPEFRSRASAKPWPPVR